MKTILNRLKRPLFATIAVLSLLMMWGTVGGMDQGSISLGRGCVQAVAFLALFAGCAWAAGGFKEVPHGK